MNADLVLEGGGVKGIGLVGALTELDEAGYAYQRVAGTSAGAIVGALVAAGMSVDHMQQVMREVDYEGFKDESLPSRLGHLGKTMSLFFKKGIYEGEYLKSWLRGHLGELGVHTFADLKIDDSGSSLPPERAYKLVVIAADISRGRLVRLPWDYPAYGLVPDEQPVVDAVRASMSIPYFFRPVQLRDRETGETSYLVDGGVLSNFPIAVFDRSDNRLPRWPTFGVKLSARPASKATVRHQFKGPLGLGAALMATAMSAHDQMHLDDECVVQRTMFVDTLDVKATDFDLDVARQDTLFENGREAAIKFLKGWDFDAHISQCRSAEQEVQVAGTPTS